MSTESLFLEVTHARRGALCLNKEQREIAENKTGITPAFANAQITEDVTPPVAFIDFGFGREKRPANIDVTVTRRQIQGSFSPTRRTV
jgi:hypothetical protein